jgi:hypothetical protein
MSGTTRGFVNESSGTTDKSTISRGGDNHESFTTFDGGGSITVISLVLVDGERFSGDSGLIDLNESVFCDDTTVCGDDGTFFDLDDITRDDFRGL